MMRKYYFINKFDTNNIDKQDKQTTIIYRNYSSKPVDQMLILKIKRFYKFQSELEITSLTEVLITT